MKRSILPALVILAAVVIVKAFYMPWARISNDPVKTAKQILETRKEGFFQSDKFKRVMGRIADGIDSVLPERFEIGASVSGYDIPRLINNEKSRVAIAFMQAIFENVKDLDRKCYVVYLMPLSGILCALLALAGLKYRPSIILMTLLSGAIGIGGIYKLKTIDFSQLPVNIVIQDGMWLTMGAFLFIFAIGIVRMLNRN